MSSTLDRLRHFAVRRSLFAPTTLGRALARLGFVQADPIRAPARAQDLVLRHRVASYAAGDLEARYPKLALEEDFFVNYGYLPRATQALMHPRQLRRPFTAAQARQAAAVLDFVRQRGEAHSREVEAHFKLGRQQNWFGGQSNAATQLLDQMHYQGCLRVARRDSGTRIYAAAATPSEAPSTAHRDAALDSLLDVVIRKYAPLPAASLGQLASHLMIGVPQWRDQRAALLRRAHARLNRVQADGTDWFWPATESLPKRADPDDQARLLAPFDPIVWDRARFERFWGWAYRFEAYIPAHKRKLGYYALPLLWRGMVVGWGNASVRGGHLSAELGLADHHPRSADLRRALDRELQSMAEFLGAESFDWAWIQR
ncbi:MAG: hypothetical protein RLZZ126_334 [Pseudomonadota bacterium]|jgi:uncharacterized protein YcaQ